MLVIDYLRSVKQPTPPVGAQWDGGNTIWDDGMSLWDVS